jgi:hypothetical protein
MLLPITIACAQALEIVLPEPPNIAEQLAHAELVFPPPMKV